MNQLNVGFSRLKDDAFYHLAVAVVSNVGRMGLFTALVPLLPPITTAAGALESATGLPNGQTRETSVAAARATLGGLLRNLALQCESTPGVTIAQLAETGFTLRRKATHTSEPPAAPGNLRLKTTGISGEMLVLIAAVLRAKMYEVEWTLDPVNGPWTMVPAFESSRGMKLTGLTRGKDYYVRVRAVATGGFAGRGATLPARWRCEASSVVINQFVVLHLSHSTTQLRYIQSSMKAPSLIIVLFVLCTAVLTSGCAKHVDLGTYLPPDRSQRIEVRPDNRLFVGNEWSGGYSEYQISGDKLQVKTPMGWIAAYRIDGNSLTDLNTGVRYAK